MARARAVHQNDAVRLPEALEELLRADRAPAPVALARVVATSGPGASVAGAAMVVRADGAAVGSLAGGCVDGAAVELAVAALASGEPVRREFTDDGDEVFGTGLGCDGAVSVLVDPAPDAELFALALARRRAGARSVLVTVVAAGGPGALGPRLASTVLLDEGGDRVAGDGPAGLAEAAGEAARRALASGRASLVDLPAAGAAFSVFVEPLVAGPRFVIVGATGPAAALAGMALSLGFAAEVVDPRSALAAPERFAEGVRTLAVWPDDPAAGLSALGPDDALCVLSHDPKLDEAALALALATPVGYVGAMGSRATHAARCARLRARGVPPAQLERVMAPIGLDLGASTPEEVAVAIAAEVVARRAGRAAPSLREGTGPVHRR